MALLGSPDVEETVVVGRTLSGGVASVSHRASSLAGDHGQGAEEEDVEG